MVEQVRQTESPGRSQVEKPVPETETTGAKKASANSEEQAELEKSQHGSDQNEKEQAGLSSGTIALMWVGFVISMFAIAYEGAHYILGSPEDSLVACNTNIQGFELNEIPIYWRIYEAPCHGNDPNYERVRYQIELLLSESDVEQSAWPTSTCGYAQVGKSGYVWGYGTDYYEIEDLDCLQPLRDLQEEKESNINYGQYFKDLVTKHQRADVGNIIAGLL